MPFLYNGLIKIKQGYNIFCKVDGVIKSRPYVLMINGGPGFKHTAIKNVGDNIKASNAKQELTPFNYIYFDALSCGASDKAINPEKEYTMENFAEIAAQVVEALQHALSLKEIDLRIIGVSFGGINSLAIPLVRPTWVTEKTSTIHLNQIISVVPLRNHEMTLHAMDYVRLHYQNDPALEEKVAAVEKIVTGNIANMQEFQQAWWIVGGLYSQKTEQEQNSFLGKLFGKNLSISLRMCGLLGHISNGFADIYDAFAGCSLDVLTTFFKNRMGDFDAGKKITENNKLFEAINLTFIAGGKDHICNAVENAEVLQKLLPGSSSIFVTNTRHSIARDRPIEETELLNHILRGTLPSNWVQNNSQTGTNFISRSQLSSGFSDQSSKIQKLDQSQTSESRIDNSFTLFSRGEHLLEAPNMKNKLDISTSYTK